MKRIAAVLVLCLPALALADNRPDSHAPISVMGDHSHHKGEFMISYRYMHMSMDQNKNGNNELGVADVLDDYLVSPVEMEMDMHMFGLMYAPTDKLTLMAMVNLIDTSMDHQIRNGIVMMNPNINSDLFTTGSDGFGDTVVSGIYELSNHNASKWLLNLGISLPTGSIDEKDIVPPVNATNPSQLPFPMQIGSGTYDILPGLTYTRLNERTSWGAQAKAVIRLADNDNDYTKGNKLEAQAWHSWLLNKNVSVSTRVSFQDWGDYDGLDNQQVLPVFNPMVGVNTVPTVDPSLRGGSQADFAAGINTSWGDSGHRLAAEIAYPVWHDLDGPQLATDLIFTLGYQLAF